MPELPTCPPVAVTNVSPHGFRLLIGEQELYVAFEQFLWFSDVSIHQIINVELPSPHHLRWPDLDIDLAVESLEHRDKYPLMCQAPHNKSRSRKC